MSAVNQIIIRDAVAADFPQIHAIYSHHVLYGKASFEEVPPVLDEMLARRKAIVDKGLPYYVAVDAAQPDKVLGYAYATLYRPRSAYRYTVEDSIYVAQDGIGKGVGKLLLQAVIERCEALGYRQMLAVIGDSANAASIGLHRNAGFQVIGTLPAVGLKFGGWVDSVFMQRALGPGATTLP